MPQAQGWYPGALRTCVSKPAGFVLGHPTDTPLWTRYQGSRSQRSDLPSQSSWSSVRPGGHSLVQSGEVRVCKGIQSGYTPRAAQDRDWGVQAQPLLQAGWEGSHVGGGSAYRCGETGVTGAGGQEAHRRREVGAAAGVEKGISEGAGMAWNERNCEGQGYSQL